MRISLNNTGRARAWRIIAGFAVGLYKKVITISGGAGAGSGYQILLKIGESPSASGADFYFDSPTSAFPTSIGGACDIHFQDMDDNPLPMWVERVNGVAPSRVAWIWVKVAANLDTEKQIACVYGGNDVAIGDGNNVFDLFDDFQGNSLNAAKWSYTQGSGGVVVTGGELVVTGDASFRALGSVNQYSDNREIIGLINPPTTTQSYVGTFGFRPTNDPIIVFQNDWDSTASSEWLSAGSKTQLSTRFQSSYHRIQVRRTGGYSDLIIDGANQAQTNTGSSTALANIPLMNVYDNGSTGKVKWVGLKKFVKVEPAFSSAGREKFIYGGKIAGIVRMKGNIVTSGTAILFTEDGDDKVETTALDSNGRFEFTGLNKNELFYVVVKQNDTSWEHIVSSRRNPA